jgi:hypothetical protein
MIDYLAIHRKRQQIARNTGACTINQHDINLDAHSAILKGYKAEYVRNVYGVDFGAYSRLKIALNSEKIYTNLNQTNNDRKRKSRRSRKRTLHNHFTIGYA